MIEADESLGAEREAREAQRFRRAESVLFHRKPKTASQRQERVLQQKRWTVEMSYRMAVTTREGKIVLEKYRTNETSGLTRAKWSVIERRSVRRWVT